MDPREDIISHERDQPSRSSTNQPTPKDQSVPVQQSSTPPQPPPTDVAHHSPYPTHRPYAPQEATDTQQGPASPQSHRLSGNTPHPGQSSERTATDVTKSSGLRFSGSPSHPLPHLPSDTDIEEIRLPPPTRTIDSNSHNGRRLPSQLDWIIPTEDKVLRKLSVGERLLPTLTNAHTERDKYSAKAKMTGYALNIAIGMQVLLGALTTGLAAAGLSARHAAIATSVLGGMATIVASFLARARGSNEPELSITRVKDLEQFIREMEAFQMDNASITSDEHDGQLKEFRERFEELLGNGSG